MRPADAIAALVRGLEMSFDSIVGVVVSLALLAYLVVAMMKPEKF